MRNVCLVRTQRTPKRALRVNWKERAALREKRKREMGRKLI